MTDQSKNQTQNWQAMMDRVQSFHDKHQFNQNGGEDMVYRVALMAEELGEISEVVTKGKGKEALAEECADLLILLMGNAIAADFDLNAAFWQKMDKILKRQSRMVDGRIRVSAAFDNDDA
ncbi:MAG: nucleoside triphosphate pyrophosphohydrolase family protein [Arenicellales bacterium]